MTTSFLSQYGSQIATLTLEHLWLTGAAMLFASFLAVPAQLEFPFIALNFNIRFSLDNLDISSPSVSMFSYTFATLQ